MFADNLPNTPTALDSRNHHIKLVSTKKVS